MLKESSRVGSDALNAHFSMRSGSYAQQRHLARPLSRARSLRSAVVAPGIVEGEFGIIGMPALGYKATCRKSFWRGDLGCGSTSASLLRGGYDFRSGDAASVRP
jgi:hypothetical protein